MATILIVDDEKNIRAHLATYVRGLGHRVETADVGRQVRADVLLVVDDEDGCHETAPVYPRGSSIVKQLPRPA